MCSPKLNKIYVFLSFSLCLILLISCRFTSYDWEDVDPPGDFFFIHHGTVPAINTTRNTAIYDNYAFSSDGNGVVAVYNIINSFEPYLISSIELPTNQIVRKIEVDWRYNLYAAVGNAGVFIINTSNPSYPDIIGDFPHILALDLSLQEDYIAVTDQFGWKLLFLLSSSHLTEINSYYYFDSRQPERILLRGNWVYVVSRNYLDIFDITNIYNIRLERSFHFYDNIVDFDIINSIASSFIVLATTQNLYYINITNPLSASIVSDFGLSLIPRTLRTRNNYLFIGWENRSLSAYRIADVLQVPSEESRINFSNVVLDIDFRNDLMYFSLGTSGLQIYYYLN